MDEETLTRLAAEHADCPDVGELVARLADAGFAAAGVREVVELADAVWARIEAGRVEP